MKKDVLTALLFGLVIGSGFALLAVKLPDMLKKSPADLARIQENEPTPSLVTDNNSILSIKEPEDNAIFTESKINISGSARSATRLVIETPESSQAIESDKNGSFTTGITLKEGGNPVYVTAIDEEGNQETKNLTLFYTTEKL